MRYGNDPWSEHGAAFRQQATPEQLAALAQLEEHLGGIDGVDTSLPDARDIAASTTPTSPATASPTTSDTQLTSPRRPLMPPPLPQEATAPTKSTQVNLDSPLGYRSPNPPPSTSDKPVDTELAQAQADASNRRTLASLGQTITNAGERPNVAFANAMRLGGGGVNEPGPKSSYWQNYGAEGDRALSDLMERRKSEAGMLQQQIAAQKAQTDADPNSPQSTLAVSLLSKYSPDIADQVKGKSFAQLRPYMGAPFIKMIEERSVDAKMTAAAAAKAAEESAKSEAAKKSLESEKTALKALYPDKADEIDKQVTSTDAAKQYRESTEGRLGRAQGFENAKVTAGINADRSLENAKKLDIFKSELPKDVPREMIDQLEALKGSDAAIAQYNKDLSKVGNMAGKLGAMGIPGAAQGYLGEGAAAGSTHQSDRERTAIALARGLEGGMARPGNVEIIQKMLANPTDSDAVKAIKGKELEDFMASKKKAFAEALASGNYKKLNNPLEITDNTGQKYSVPSQQEADALKAELKSEGKL